MAISTSSTLPRWPVVVALGGTLLIVSLLCFMPVPKTDIELDVQLSEVSFVLEAEQKLFEGIGFTALGVPDEIREVYVPRSPNREEQRFAASALRFIVASAGEQQGTLSLGTLLAPAGTSVRVRLMGAPYTYRVELQGATLELQVDVNGPVRIDSAGQGSERYVFSRPSAVILKPETKDIRLDVTVRDVPRAPLIRQTPASHLSLASIEQTMDPQHTLVRRLSTILAGTLYFEDLNGRQYPLRQAEVLRFGTAIGELSTLQFQEDRITLRFAGWVSGMTTGARGRSVMPTWLEYLAARQGLSLLWGSALYLFGLIIGILRWWRSPT